MVWNSSIWASIVCHYRESSQVTLSVGRSSAKWTCSPLYVLQTIHLCLCICSLSLPLSLPLPLSMFLFQSLLLYLSLSEAVSLSVYVCMYLFQFLFLCLSPINVKAIWNVSWTQRADIRVLPRQVLHNMPGLGPRAWREMIVMKSFVTGLH